MKLELVCIIALLLAYSNAEGDGTTAGIEINGESDSENTQVTAESDSAPTIPPTEPSDGQGENNVANPEPSPPASSSTAEANSLPPTPPDPTPETVNSSPTIPPATATEFACESVGRFEYQGECNKYYYCWDLIHYAVFTCSKVFDPNSKRCVNDYSLCPNSPKCTEDRQIFADPEDKNKFYECKSEHAGLILRREDCEKGREFNSDLGYCTLTSESEYSSSDSDESSEKFKCHSIGRFIDFDNETRYYECTLKSVAKGSFKTIRRKCAKGTVFSGGDVNECIPLPQ